MIQEETWIFWEIIVLVSFITRPLTFDYECMINIIFFLIRDYKVATIQGGSRRNTNVLGDDIIGHFEQNSFIRTCA